MYGNPKTPLLLLLLTPALFLGCSKKDSGEAPAAAPAAPTKAAATPAKADPTPAKAAAISPAAKAEAEKFFTQVCAVCHGAAGAGDGAGAANLTPKPRAFGDKDWQASVTDEHLKKVILQGGMAVGKSPIMPGSPQLKEKPEVLEALIAHVRGFGK